jgi:hypothetical protein
VAQLSTLGHIERHEIFLTMVVADCSPIDVGGVLTRAVSSIVGESDSYRTFLLPWSILFGDGCLHHLHLHFVSETQSERFARC